MRNKHFQTLLATLAFLSGCESANSIGTFNDGTVNLPTANLPVREGVTKVVAGANHTCALFSTGTVKCWGHNNLQQLGIGAGADQPVPTQVVGVADAIDLYAGVDQTCAILAEGEMCWGNGSAPTLTGQTGVGEIQFGSDYSCIRGLNGFSSDIETPGSLSCTGGADIDLQLGDGSVVSALQVATGNLHTCALQPDSSVQCWGDDTFGELGNGAFGGSQANPFTIQAGAPLANYPATLIAAGNGFTCAAGFPNQDVSCWGDNAFDELGTAGANQNLPVEASATPINALAIATNALAHFVCVIQLDDTVWCWGDNSLGQLGTGGPAVPAPAGAGPTLGRAHGIAVGQNHACAIYYGNGTVVPTSSDPVPDPSPSPLPAPSPLPPSTDSEQFGIYCWGDNSDGQLGIGSIGGPQNTPQLIPTGSLYP